MHRLISQQMLLEHEVLARLSDALRTAVSWNPHGDLSHKLETVQFLAQSFQRHVERMLDLEEHDGYMDMVHSSFPEFDAQVAAFRREHEAFRQGADGIVYRLENSAALDAAETEALFEEVAQLLEAVDAHNKREMELLRQLVMEQASGEPADGESSR